MNSPAIYRISRTGITRRPSPGARACCGSRVEAFSAELAVLHSDAQGDGGPQVNPDFPGGVRRRSTLRPRCRPAATTGSSRRSISPGRATPTSPVLISATTRDSPPSPRRVPTTRPRARRCRTTPTALPAWPTAAICRTTPAFRPIRASSTTRCSPIRRTPLPRKCVWCRRPARTTVRLRRGRFLRGPDA